MDETSLYIADENGVEKQMQILFTTDVTAYGKKYVFFYDPEDEEGEVHFMSFDDEHNLYAVESEEECDMLAELFDTFMMEDYEEE